MQRQKLLVRMLVRLRLMLTFAAKSRVEFKNDVVKMATKYV